ncbi:MAG: hypothetical protein AABY52_07415 [Deltaproteobacteria bacterium]
MTRKEGNDDYIVLYEGAKLSRNQANRVGLGIIFGIIGIFISVHTPMTKIKLLSYTFIALLSVIGYCFGFKLFKNKRKE